MNAIVAVPDDDDDEDADRGEIEKLTDDQLDSILQRETGLRFRRKQRRTRRRRQQP